MENKNLLINLLPLILDSRKNKISYKSIKDTIESSFSLLVSERQLAQLVSDFHNDKLKIKYKHLRIAITSSFELLEDDNLRQNTIRLHNSSEVTFFLECLDIKPENELTLDKIKALKNPIDRIYAKWFTRNFNIHNSELIDLDTCSEKELQEMQLIPSSIDTLFKEIQDNKLKLIMKI